MECITWPELTHDQYVRITIPGMEVKIEVVEEEGITSILIEGHCTSSDAYIEELLINPLMTEEGKDRTNGKAFTSSVAYTTPYKEE